MNKIEEIKISVLTPSYNSHKTIKRAIDSVLIQNYKNFEHIIVDGGSNDGTLEILKEYNHLIWISENDNGQSDAMNKAFDLSSGTIVVYLNSDDYFLPDVFKKVIADFNSDKKIEMIVGQLFLLENKTMRILDPTINYENIIKYYRYIFPANPVSYFYKRYVQEKFGKFSIENKYAMDYEFILYATKNHKIKKTLEPFGVFDYHQNTKTANSKPFNSCHKVIKNHLRNEKFKYIKYLIDRFFIFKIEKSKILYLLKNLHHGVKNRIKGF